MKASIHFIVMIVLKKVTENDVDVDAGPFHYDGCGIVSDVVENK